MDWKIELIFVPVTDVDRAKDFYDQDRLPRRSRPGALRGAAVRADDPSRLRVLDRVRQRPRASTWSRVKQNTIQVVVPDADEALAHLRSVGVEANGVDEQAWGRFVTLRRPRRQHLDAAGAARARLTEAASGRLGSPL